MPGKQELVREFSNFRQTERLLKQIAPSGTDFSWFTQAAGQTATRWYRLGHQHLKAARTAMGDAKAWRCVVSRCYYGIYSFSKAVRFFEQGAVKPGSEDHRLVGDLPEDFPDRADWSNVATEMRRDRNLADYEPWTDSRRRLRFEPRCALQKAEDFADTCRSYLRNKGVAL